MPLVLYIASVVGAVALLLIMPKRRLNLPLVGAVLGAATLGAVWLAIANLRLLPPVTDHGLWYWLPQGAGEGAALIYYYLFSAIAIVAGVRVVTHPRPVYSALWFVMVVCSTAGLFLTLSAEFMAFAMLIIYAGAILVTYMFVIMLATSADDPNMTGNDTADHDRVAREPVAAAAAGFLLLAVLLSVFFSVETLGPMGPAPQAMGPSDAELLATTLTDRRSDALGPVADQAAPTADEMVLSNAERVGLDLFQSHPLGLELAGVILLVSLIGAVVIARTRVEEEEQAPGSPVPDRSGATVHPTHEPGPHEREAIGEVGGRMGA